MSPDALISAGISAGTLDGTPAIALPLADDDGRRRYRLGWIELTAEDAQQA